MKLRRLVTAVACLMMAIPALAQYSRYDNIVLNKDGRPVPGASVYVCSNSDPVGVFPCPTQVSVFTTATGTTSGGGSSQFTQPAITDTAGNYHFYVVASRYKLQFKVGTTWKELPDQDIGASGTGGGGCTVWGCLIGSLANQLDLQAALNLKEDKANRGASNGYAPLDGTGVLPTANLPAIPITKGGTGQTTIAADQVTIGIANNSTQQATIPDCSNSVTSKVLYSQSTHLFSCGTDQTAGGGTGITTLNTLTGATQTFSSPGADANVQLTINSSGTNHAFTVAWLSTLSKARQHAATVYNDQGNTFSTGTQDFTGVTLFKQRVAAGLTTATNGESGYDSTNANWHKFKNGVDAIDAMFPASLSVTDADCVKWVKSGAAISLGDAGAPCGSGGGGGSLPWTTLGDTLYFNGSIAVRLPAPTTPNSVPQILTSSPSVGVGQAPVWKLPGMGGRNVTGTTDTIVVTDRAAAVIYNNVASIAVTLPQAGTAGFDQNFAFSVKNEGQGTVTITPTTSTIGGNSTLQVTKGQDCLIFSIDNANYSTKCASGVLSVSTGLAIAPSTTGIQLSLSSVPLSVLAPQSPDTIVMNATGGTASPQAVAIGTCFAAPNLITYNTSTHAWGCRATTTTDMIAAVNAQSGTTYTVVSADNAKLVTFNNAASVAVTQPQCGSAGFAAGWFDDAFNRGAGAVTITPTTSTINGGATLTLNQGQGAHIVCDGTNYSAWVSATPASGGGDFSSNTSTSVDGEFVLFSGTGGKTGKRATGTGFPRIESGVLNTDNPAESTLTDAATITWAIGSARIANAVVTLGGNRTLNITGPVSGSTYLLRIVQDGTGSRTLTLGTGCTWKVINGGAGAITLSTAANAVDILTFFYNGTNCYANLGKNYN